MEDKLLILSDNCYTCKHRIANTCDVLNKEVIKRTEKMIVNLKGGINE